MTIKTTLAALAAFFTAFAAVGETMLFSAGESAAFAVDSRPAPRIAAATETLAYSTAWGGGATATVKAGDKTLATETGEGTVVWNAAAEAPGLVTLTHTAGGETLTADFAVLGEDSIAVDCDRLPSSATWASNRVYVVMRALTVPSGVALTIQPGAVVKFVAGASLTVASGGSCVAKGAIFTHIADDTAGGDTLFDGDATKPVTGAYEVSGSVTDDDATEYRYTAPIVTSGTISSSTKWRGHTVYKVTGNLTVASGATLTIQPGAIIKFASGVSLTVSSGATLDAQGTRAAPIVFTSIKDDDWGGDTNGDGDATTAQAGDWHQIRVSGTGKFNYAQILYTSSAENYGGLEVYGGQVDFDNSVIAHCKYECANFHSSGRMTARNSVFADASLAFGYYGGSNAKAINCIFADLTTAIRQSSKILKNCVFYRCVNFTDQGGDSSSFDHCVFYNPSGYGAQRYTKVGSNGNIWADPLFTDPDNGDFTISANSPCVDAGDGTVAPETDYYGRPRMNVKKIEDTGVANADGICPDIGIYEVDGAAAVAAPDLAVVSLAVPASVRAGEEITVAYVVTNRAAAINATVRDSFAFVAEDAALGGQRVAAGEVSQTYGISSNGCASVSATLTVPSLKAGAWRLCVTVNAERDVYEKITANNMGKAAETTSVAVPAIAAGTTRIALAAGENVFAVTGVPASGGTVVLTLPAGAAAYGANGYVPGAERSDAVAVNLGGGRVALVFPARSEGTAAYLAVESGTAGEVAVEVTETALALYGASPARLANTGTVRLTVAGAGLEGAEVALVGAATLKATAVEAVDAAHAVATFALDKAAVGTYAVRVTAGGKTAMLDRAVELYKTTTGAKLEAKLVLPASVRDGRVYTAWIEYANTGDEDMPAPLFTVKRTDSATKLKATLADDFGVGPLYFVGIGSAYPAGVLAAGDSGRIPLYFTPSGKYALALSHAKEETAATAYPQFSSTADYRQAVAEAATRLNARGTVEYRVRECVNFVLAERAGRAVAAISGTAVDAATREPLAGVTVTATLTNDATRTASATADADGRFTLAMLADGGWRLAVDGAVTDGTNVVAVAGQNDVNDRTLAARKLAKVTGTVLTADTHEPLAGAAVRLYREGGELAAEETTTDEDGAFGLEGVVSGTYALVVNSADGYVGEVVTNVVLSLGGTYAAGAFELAKGAVLYGTVTAGGKPVTNGTVYATYEDGSAARAACSTNGTYCFDGLPPYAYQVRYAGEEASTDYVGATVVAGERRQFDLTAKATPLFFPMRPRGYGTLTTSFMVADPVLATNATAFAWDFDADGTVDSREAEPSHTYAAVGTYSVTLVATTPQGERTSVYENCVTVEEAIENVLNANAFRVDETAGIDCTALGETTLTLKGTPPMTLKAGVVVGGQFGGEWYIRKIKTVSQSGTTYVLTTEDATLDDLYASYCFTFAEPVQVVEPVAPSRAVSAAAASPRLVRASGGGDDKIVKYYANGGLSLIPTVGVGLNAYCDWAKPLNGVPYYRIGVSGKLFLEINGSAEVQVGAKIDPSFELPVSIPTSVPFLDAKGKLTFGAFIGAEGKFGGNFRAWANPRISIGMEKIGSGGWHALKPFDLSDRGSSGSWFDVAGALNGEAYIKVTAGLTALKAMEVMAGAKLALKESLSSAVGGDAEWNASVGLNGVLEPSLIKTENIPLIGKYLSFLDVGWSVDIGGVDLLLERITSPSPEFAANPDQGDAPLSVSFTDKSEPEKCYLILDGDFTLQPSSYDWDFGDGRKSTAKSPSVTYGEDGEYLVTLKVKGTMLTGNRKATHKVYVGKEKPPEDDQQNDDKGGGTPAKSCDPNEMAGPEGVGTNRLVKAGEWMDYTIYFENKTNATAAAQEVFVDAQLDANLDWSTFETGEIAFNNQNETGLAGYRNGTKTVAQNGADYKVQMSVAFDAETGKVRWYLRSYDPNRADYGYWPASVDAGFLPPNDALHRGEGHITYRVKVREDAPAKARIDASASIVFDYNDPIETDPAWWNTVGTPGVSFESGAIDVDEGGAIELAVSGGSDEATSSVQVYLAYQTASAADVDLKTATVDGVTPKGGVKFPLTLSWAAGDTEPKTISIPVKSDKTVEADETLVFQLAAAQGQELGEVTTCAVTIRDTNVAADYAAKQAKETVKTKKGVETNALAVACCAGDGSGSACGYTTGQGRYSKGSKATLKATARPGWEFKGWGEVVSGGAVGDGTPTLPDGAVTNILSDKASWSVTLTNDAEIVALFGRIPYMAGLASPADGGKVSGSGYCAAGKKVTLKATANKNFTFTGWIRADDSAASDGIREQSTTITTPTLIIDRTAKPAKSDAKQTVLTNVSESVTYYATFKSDPTVSVSFVSDDSAAVPGKVTGVGKYAAGKKVTLKATANKGYVFVGWWEGTVSGGGEGLAALPEGDPVSHLASLTIDKMPSNDVSYAAAFITAGLDKSNIVAKVNGMAFETTVGGGTPTLPTNIWAGVYLEWPVAASALSATTIKVAGLPSGLKFAATPVVTKTTTGSGKNRVTTIVTNVPANTIYGAPSAASKVGKDGTVTPSAVKITVTTAGKNAQNFVIDTTVVSLPAWAQGTFTGPSYAVGRAETNGVATVTVAASGKISAKQPVSGKSASFAASYFDCYAVDENAFAATLTAKVGKEVVTNRMVVCSGLIEAALPAGGTVTVTNGYIEADLFDAGQYNWKVEPWKTLIKPLDRQTSTYFIDETGAVIDTDETVPTLGENGIVGKVSFKFAASGTVTITGEFVTGIDTKGKQILYKASGSTILVPSADGCCIFVYLAPNATKGFPGYVRCFILETSEGR